MTTLISTFLASALLPLLALVALFLRGPLVTGAYKKVLLVVGVILLGYTVVEEFITHRDELGPIEIAVGLVVSLISVALLSYYKHSHTHSPETDGARGIVISEAFHSLFDGAVIGSSFLINPVLGVATTLGIVTHEATKMIGTAAVLRGLKLSMRKTIVYGMLAQAGSPIAALFVYFLGRSIDHEQFHLFEIASLASLSTIILWILWLEWNHHAHIHSHSHAHR